MFSCPCIEYLTTKLIHGLARQTKLYYQQAVKQELQTRIQVNKTEPHIQLPQKLKAINQYLVTAKSHPCNYYGFCNKLLRNHGSLSLMRNMQVAGNITNIILYKASFKHQPTLPVIYTRPYQHQMAKMLLIFMGMGMRPEVCTDGNYNSNTKRSFKQQLSHRA